MSRVFKAEHVDLASPVELPVPQVAPLSQDKTAAANPAVPPPNPVQLLAVARAEAEQILAGAEQEARAIVERARREAESLKEQARQEGLAEGRRTGFEQGLKEAAAKVAEGERIRREALAERAKIMRELKPEITQLVLRIAKKVIHDELSQNPEAVSKVIEAALERAVVKENIRLLVHPLDFPQVAAKRDEISRRSGALDLEVIPDPGIGRGGCRIETGFGLVEAQVADQFAEIERALLEVAAYE